MLNAIKILTIAAALVTMAMPAYTHDASNYAHRELYVKVEVGLLRECVRQMWAGDDDNMPLEAWEPMARLCLQIVRASRD